MLSNFCNPNDARQRIGVLWNEEGRDRNICLSLRAGTNMRRRDEEAARDVGAMRINGWDVGLSFVRLSVPKSIAAFRSTRSRYYCYDRVSKFLRNVARRLAERERRSPDSNSFAIVYTEAREGPRATKMFGIETIVSPPGVVCQRPPTETSPIYLTKQSVNSLKTAPTKKELDIGRERNFPSQRNRADSFSLPAGIILFSSTAAAVRCKTRNTNCGSSHQSSVGEKLARIAGL